MFLRPSFAIACLCVLVPAAGRSSAPPQSSATCRRAVIEGELNAGQPFSQVLGQGLRVFFQPIRSGWILRVLPAAGPLLARDYAQLATPPYDSVTALSLSTDFAFRAQDAVGWNPRRFRFATSAGAFRGLEQAYERFHAAVGLKASGTQLPGDLQAELAAEIARTSEGTLTILDSRLIPGTADQWRMAAAVASHFASTAHTVVQEADGSTTPLGRLLWIRFRLEMNLPQGFRANPALRLQPYFCSNF